MNSTRQHSALIFLPVQMPLALSRPLSRAEIDRLAPSDYAIYLVTVRARQRLLRRGRRNDPVDSIHPNGGYQTTTTP